MKNPEQIAKELIKGCAKMEEGGSYVYNMCGRLNDPVKPIRYYCPKCKYEWDTNSKLINITRPNCQKKVKVKKDGSSSNKSM